MIEEGQGRLLKQLYLGNEAVARGAWEAGVTVASAYPGTPSTEITENLAKYDEIYAEWAPNEKVALEVAVGASLGGARAMAAMKHVGLNVAADPLFTASYSGVNGGLVVVVADDPGMNSSQNEQDTRLVARAALVPVLEPADSGECLQFTKLAYELSERYDTPIILRLTTRVAHARTLAEVGERAGVAVKAYKRDIMKNVMMPAMARKRHLVVEARMNRMAQDANTMDINRVERRGGKMGVVTSGISYQYVREALPEADVFKLGIVYPLPLEALREFAKGYETLYVVEELEPFLEDALKAAGIPCVGKELFGVQGELGAQVVAQKLAGRAAPAVAAQDLPIRPPVLCPGCPHRGTFHIFNKLGLTVTGDIGCYTLAALEPLAAMDACLCMGASIGMAHGMEKARGRGGKVVAVLGDSTFIHSGITGLINAVYNDSAITVAILDNSITAMTGHQHNPATGKTLKGANAAILDLEGLCRSLGVKDLKVADPFDIKASEAALKDSLAFQGPSVVIFRSPCALLPGLPSKPRYRVNTEVCRKCKRCMRLGCPAIESTATGGVAINAELCNGCGLCASVCPFGAIGKEEG